MVSFVASDGATLVLPVTTITDFKVLINNDLTNIDLRHHLACVQPSYARAACAVTMVVSSAFAARGPKKYAKLDDELNERAGHAPSAETTSVIVRVKGRSCRRNSRSTRGPATSA